MHEVEIVTDAVLLDGAEISSAGTFPLIVMPYAAILRESATAACEWFEINAERIASILKQHGCILFRGFAIDDTPTFSAISRIFPSHHGGYMGGATPRSAIQDNVFEATRVPPPYKIQLHQEMSYLPHYPTRLMFYCRVAPTVGGETIIGDMRKITANLPHSFHATFAKRKLRYERNLAAPEASARQGHWLADFHRSWSDCFGTNRREEIERACHDLGMEYMWESDGSLKLVHIANPYRVHAATGASLWFNHIAVLHDNPRSMGAGNVLLQMYKKLGKPLPNLVTFDDGEPLAPELVYSLLDTLDAHTITFPWERGDLMMVDNMLVAHGRNRFSGARDIQVTLHD